MGKNIHSSPRAMGSNLVLAVCLSLYPGGDDVFLLTTFWKDSHTEIFMTFLSYLILLFVFGWFMIATAPQLDATLLFPPLRRPSYFRSSEFSRNWSSISYSGAPLLSKLTMTMPATDIGEFLFLGPRRPYSSVVSRTLYN